jgi:hypothetical protein
MNELTPPDARQVQIQRLESELKRCSDSMRQSEIGSYGWGIARLQHSNASWSLEQYKKNPEFREEGE